MTVPCGYGRAIQAGIAAVRKDTEILLFVVWRLEAIR